MGATGRRPSGARPSRMIAASAIASSTGGMPPSKGWAREENAQCVSLASGECRLSSASVFMGMAMVARLRSPVPPWQPRPAFRSKARSCTRQGSQPGRRTPEPAAASRDSGGLQPGRERVSWRPHMQSKVRCQHLSRSACSQPPVALIWRARAGSARSMSKS